MLKIDKNTFGDSRAEIILTEKLNKLGNEKLARKIGRHFVHLNQHLKNIKIRKNENNTGQVLYSQWRKESFSITDKMIGKENPELATYIKNCTIKRLRKAFLNA